MQDKHLVPIMPVEHTARHLHNLAITRAPEFLRSTAAIGMIDQLFNMAKDAFDKLFRCN